MALSIDLNADAGESLGAWRMGQDEDLFTAITSVNVACGFHAGDPHVMRRTVALAKDHGVAVGAHPGFPDLVGFGRREMDVTPDDVYDDVLYQTGALDAFVRASGLRLAHVKPHGALYNQAGRDLEMAKAIAHAVKNLDPGILLVGQPFSALEKAAESVGVPFVREVFADRAYQADGSLVFRSCPGAVLHDRVEVARRTVAMVLERGVRAITGEWVPLEAETVCVHGDTPGAVEMAVEIRRELEKAGISARSVRSDLVRNR